MTENTADAIEASAYDEARRNTLAGVRVSPDAVPHLRPAAVNTNPPDVQAFEAARLAARVNAERAAQGLEPLEVPEVPEPEGDLSPAADEAARDELVVPDEPVPPAREPVADVPEDGSFARAYLSPRD
jgi:hypothetical protein